MHDALFCQKHKGFIFGCIKDVEYINLAISELKIFLSLYIFLYFSIIKNKIVYIILYASLMILSTMIITIRLSQSG